MYVRFCATLLFCYCFLSSCSPDSPGRDIDEQLAVVSQDMSFLVGSIYAPLPDAWAEVSGAVIGGYDSNFSVSLHKDAFSNDYMITTAYGHGRTDQGQPLWKISSATRIGAIPESQELVLTGCESGGSPDESLIAIVNLAEVEWYTDIARVWRANAQTGQLEPLGTEGIRCANEAAGV